MSALHKKTPVEIKPLPKRNGHFQTGVFLARRSEVKTASLLENHFTFERTFVLKKSLNPAGVTPVTMAPSIFMFTPSDLH